MDIYPTAAEVIRSVPVDLPVRSAASCCPAKVCRVIRITLRICRTQYLGGVSSDYIQKSIFLRSVDLYGHASCCFH